MTARRITAGLAALVLAVAACGGGDDGAGTTTSAPDTSTTTLATTTTEATTTTTMAPATTTTVGTTEASSEEDELPTELGGGTYVVGEEIRTGFWVSDQCGCYWAYVDEMGNSTPGTGEDAEVRESDYAIELGGCNWTWDG